MTKQTAAGPYGYGHRKDDLNKRFNRLEGQLRGIRRMIDNDEYCIDILTQISAVRGALDKVALGILQDHTRHCLAQPAAETRQERADELVAAISRML